MESRYSTHATWRKERDRASCGNCNSTGRANRDSLWWGTYAAFKLTIRSLRQEVMRPLDLQTLNLHDYLVKPCAIRRIEELRKDLNSLEFKFKFEFFYGCGNKRASCRVLIYEESDPSSLLEPHYYGECISLKICYRCSSKRRAPPSHSTIFDHHLPWRENGPPLLTKMKNKGWNRTFYNEFAWLL